MEDYQVQLEELDAQAEEHWREFVDALGEAAEGEDRARAAEADEVAAAFEQRREEG